MNFNPEDYLKFLESYEPYFDQTIDEDDYTKSFGNYICFMKHALGTKYEKYF